MADYLSPNDLKLTVSEKQLLFAIRNKMIKIPSNFRGTGTGDKMCVTGCGEEENRIHLYKCETLNGKKKVTHSYEKIYKDGCQEQIHVFNIMKENIAKRNQIEENQRNHKNANPSDLNDPLKLGEPSSNL